MSLIYYNSARIRKFDSKIGQCILLGCAAGTQQGCFK
jgi:hypothetical protein